MKIAFLFRKISEREKERTFESSSWSGKNTSLPFSLLLTPFSSSSLSAYAFSRVWCFPFPHLPPWRLLPIPLDSASTASVLTSTASVTALVGVSVTAISLTSVTVARKHSLLSPLTSLSVFNLFGVIGEVFCSRFSKKKKKSGGRTLFVCYVSKFFRTVSLLIGEWFWNCNFGL